MEDYFDYGLDQFTSDYYEEFSQDVLSGKNELSWQVIDQFMTQRLQEFYLKHPEVLSRAVWALTEATHLLSDSPSASIVLSVAAAEIALRSALLRPILYGLVHTQEMAEVVVQLLPRHGNHEAQRLLKRILGEYGGVDLDKFMRDGSNLPLSKELSRIREVRNKVVHCGEKASPEDAETSLQIAALVLEELFPKVLAKLGLCIDSGHRIQPTSSRPLPQSRA